jgi:hypothetical protein
MQMPNALPSRPLQSETKARHRGHQKRETNTLSPAACCAEACVNVPFVGRVCHCILDLPVCP